MARFQYTAVDRYGESRSGRIEASGIEEARAKLAALGLQAGEAVIEPIAEDAAASGRLSSAEAVQFGGQIADLAAAQLPLGPGLRAMAEEFPRGSASRVLRRLGDRIDAGMPLEEALAAEGPRLPEHLRLLLIAAVRSGRFTEVIDEMVAVGRSRIDVRQRLRLLFAYPGLLFLLILLLYGMGALVVPGFRKIYMDFGAELPGITKVMLAIYSPMAVAAVFATIGLCAIGLLLAMGGRSRVPWIQRMLYGLPIAGAVWRFRGLAEFSRLMGLLLELQVPLPQALRAIGAGLREGDLRAAAGTLAEAAEAGIPVSDQMALLRQFPATFRPLVQWAEKSQGGEKSPRLADAFRGAAEMCEGRLRFQSHLAGAVLMPITFLVVLFFVGNFVGALLLPLISLIQHLS